MAGRNAEYHDRITGCREAEAGSEMQLIFLVERLVYVI